MKLIANVLWFLITGLFTGLGYFFLGLLWCITIIGIPFGIQSFKFAVLSFAPFGKKVNANFGKHPIANVIWAVFGGFALAVGFFVTGIFWCITILGIPLGKQSFKFAKLSFMPFGATIEKK